MVEGLAEAGYGKAITRESGDLFAVAQIGPVDYGSATGGEGVRVFADARLDARAELLETIGDTGLSLVSNDEDLILGAWLKWGVDCPRHLIGDYAFVVHDPAAQLLFCARDHAGARPLFYSLNEDRFAFASDVNALLAMPDLDPAFDDDVVLTSLLSRHFFPLDRSWYRSIAKLAPGHSLQLGRDGVRVERYWSPGRTNLVRYARVEDYARRLRELVEVAVDDRLRGARRLGVHVSGGLDSTAVAALAVERLRARGEPDPVGFSWQSRQPDAPVDSEPAWSEAVRASLGIELLDPAPDADSIAELLRRDVTRWPDPGNQFNELPVQREAARRGIDVILSGWGGDQGASFVGRGRDEDLFVRGRWFALWKRLGPIGARRKVRRFLGAARASVVERLRRTDSPLEGFPSAALRRRACVLPIPIVRKTSVARTMRDLFENGAIQSRLETWAASGARLGIEYRYPLLDRRVLDFCYNVPDEIFARKGVGRWLMRTAMGDLFPEVVAHYASKHEPVRGAELAPVFLEALARMGNELRRRRGRFARATHVDVDGLSEWLDRPRNSVSGQWRGRLALQFLDFPDASTGPEERE